MTAEHRFECVRCGHRVHVTGADSDAARQAARERGAAHVNDAHADLLAGWSRWPDELAPGDLLAGEAAYGSLRGWLVPADDLLVCADCGYYFGDDERESGATNDDEGEAAGGDEGADHEGEVADTGEEANDDDEQGDGGDGDGDRAPVEDSGLVCTVCYERRVADRADSMEEAIEEFVR